jgi:NAD(P)-dependent dehydrogenase (short-subunit alcohol dehydrogenase family)
MQDPYSLTGKTILVTGASSGIGRAIAVQASQRGAGLWLTARNQQRLDETLGLLSPGQHEVFAADMGRDTDITALAAHLPVLDGLVLCAGMLKTLPAAFIKRESLEQVFNVNLHGSVLLLQRLLKKKWLRQGASVCFISSVASMHPTLGNAIYSASKGAINSFTRALALELAPKQIRVNAILPGFVETALIDDGAINQEQLLKHKQNYPIGRFGKPEDIAYLSVYLLSDASQWMTGSLLTIDGEYSIK